MEEKKEEQVVKPYKPFQSQGHVNKKKACRRNKFKAYCLLRYFNAYWFFWPLPTLTLHQGQGHRHQHGHVYMASLSSCQVESAIADINTVREIAIVVQVQNVSSLRRSCDLE